MDKVSIVMSTYNERLDHLSLAIESIIKQTYKNIEFIILLDNPQNRSIKRLVQSYAEKDYRIKIIANKKNIGLTASLNKGFRLASGNYFARMDADDISDCERIDYELIYLKKENVDLVGCMTRRIDENGIVVNKLANPTKSTEFLSKKIRFDNCIAHPTWLFKKEVYEKINGYREIKTAEDYDFLLRLVRAKCKIGICDKCLLSYRISPSGISRSNSLKQLLTSRILQKNFNNINDINQSIIDSKICNKITMQSNENFEKGVQLIDKAVEQLKKKDFMAIVNIAKALLSSHYIWIKLYQLFRIHTII